MPDPHTAAEPLNLENYLEQLGRALQNQNLPCSVTGTPENAALLQRIQETRDQIAALQTPTP